MGENDQHKYSREWSIDIDKGNKLEEVLEPGTDCCIYRVPQHLRKINEEAYTPSLISIGPLHFGREELMGMESQKRRYWSEFAKRPNIAQKLEEFETYIKNQEQTIRAHYSVTSTILSSEYIEIILRDAIFIIELFLRKYHLTEDFLLKPPLEISITVDLLLLENQLPYFVLNDLYSIAFPTSKGNPSVFFDISVKFFNGMSIFNHLSISADQQPRVKHFTDILRRCLLKEVHRSTVQQSNGNVDRLIDDLPCVTKLNKSGLVFKGIERKCLLDISWGKTKFAKWLPAWFEVNEVKVPSITICDETEFLLRNLMALEMFHYPTQTHICNYAVLMDYLIDSAKDVDLLVDKKIIVNCVGDNEAIHKMFNRLCSHITISGSCYYKDAEKMKTHYNNKCNHAKATLMSVYFNNLWTTTATFAATFLLLLTVTQTICSIVQL
ncbi:hypothetical protein Ddye_018245 [Dipteronia dyeriana]|uniref:Uncharacterized protein n=1 Tax=Dipteronia dyeriana TaxID=168575 RepID=A0AAD9UA66_9ROSI|nr:hypothetical protein Ddye_018245 [Dipteronia dyeriana]